ncbi:hypothetical protein EBR04_07220, partial [bacterium]|nr:hypothetical protein [bacterium]
MRCSLSSARRPALRPLLSAGIVFLACPWASADQPPAAQVQSLFDGASFIDWEPSKTPVPFEGDTIRQASGPDEHGIRIRKGQLMSKPFPVEPFAF